MTEEPAAGTKPAGEKKLPWVNWYVYNKGVEYWDRIFGPKHGMFNPITREGKQQASAVLQENQDLFRLNNGKIDILSDIEKRWGMIEEMLFGPEGFHFAKDKFNEAVFTDRYRSLQYFRDPNLTAEETVIFKEKGTVELDHLKISIDRDKAIRKAEETKRDKESIITKLRAQEPLDERGAAALSDAEQVLQKTDEFLANPDEFIEQVSILPKIEIGEVIAPFANGKPERIVAIGTNNITRIVGDFNALNTGIDHFASSSGLPASVRTPINQLMQEILKSLETLSKIELKHGEKTEEIQKTIVSLMSQTGGVGIVLENRPNKNWIRFSHTYKIIKPYKVKKVMEDGKEKKVMVYFKDKYADFKRDDELEIGKDENGWPLEVYEDHGKWYVLVDKWWSELCENQWHEKVIMGKPGGAKKWEEKITRGVKISNRFTKTYRANGCHIRQVPDEWVGDLHNVSESGVGDIDPLDKISFISNETDAFRDDFRDGRYHPNSKSSMDYIIAGKDGLLPSKPIRFNIDTTDPEVRIKFIPIYYTSENAPRPELVGELNPNGGLQRANMNKIIPDDEKKVSRKYDMETDFGSLTNQVRSPRHLNPAFDRSAVEHTFIHWGRMLYYETTDGITKWSENPFPHVATRGLSKYIINLVIKKSFSFDEAREILKGNKWDYGIRHYGEPFTIDPLGPGGVLEHAQTQAGKSGSPH